MHGCDTRRLRRADCPSGVCLNGETRAAACDDQVQRRRDRRGLRRSCGGCDDGLLCADADCSGGVARTIAAPRDDYARFGRTTVPDGNLGGANVPLQWPDGIAAPESPPRRCIDSCLRVLPTSGAPTTPSAGKSIASRRRTGYGLRYDGPRAGDPAPRRIKIRRGCNGGAYLRVMHGLVPAAPQRPVHPQRLVLSDLGVLGGSRHPPTAGIIDDPTGLPCPSCTSARCRGHRINELPGAG